MPELSQTVTIRFSTRLHRSLGRCRPATGLITLRADLRDGDPARLREVLCHEAAHVAARLKFGAGIRPHGVERRSLVAAAGYEPRVRMLGLVPPHELPALPQPLAYEHRYPVCHSKRFARRRMPRWRCAECLDAGLEGTLLITHRPTPKTNRS